MKKILVIRFSSLGDITLTTPVYRNIKEALPDSFIAVLTKHKYGELLEKNDCIDELILYGKGRSLWSVIKYIRSNRFDYIIDLHANLRSLLVRLFGGAAKNITYRKNAFARRMFILFRKSSPRLERHTIDRYLDVLEILGIPVKTKQPEISFSGHKPAAMVKFSKMLVVQTSFIGDIVLTVPILRAIKENHSGAKLHLLTTPQGAQMLDSSSFLDRIIVYDKKGRDSSLGAYLNLIKNLRKENYDIAVVPHRSFRSALLVRLLGIKERIGFENSQGRVFFTRVLPFNWSMHDIERNHLLLRPLGIDITQPDPGIDISGEVSDIYLRCLEENGISKDDVVVGINPGSIWETKKWPPDRYGRLIKMIIKELGCKVVLFGGKADLYLEEEIKRSADDNRLISLIGKTDLKELLHLISRCGLFVTNDSGPMHIAVGLRVPVVAIFGATTRDLGFFPYGEGNTVVEVDLACRPCGLHGGKSCPKDHFDCMKKITVEMVFEEVKKKTKDQGLRTKES